VSRDYDNFLLTTHCSLFFEEKVAIMERMRQLLPDDAWTDKNELQSEGCGLKGAADGED